MGLDMLSSYQLGIILKDERITCGLSDPDGRFLMERLVQHADALAVQYSGQSLLDALRLLSGKGRLVARIVYLWTTGNQSSAIQLAASGGLGEFIPSPLASEESLINALLPA
jgi:hypothetical protein